MKWRPCLLMLIALCLWLLILNLCGGCSAHPSSREATIRSVGVATTQAVDLVDKKVGEARGEIASADRVLAYPAAPVDVPLARAHLREADKSLSEVPPINTVIRAGVLQVVDQGVQASQGEAKAQSDLVKEKDHYLGYKTRRILMWFGIFLGISVLLGGAGFLWSTLVPGGAVASFLLSGRFSSFFSSLLRILSAIFHTVTFGIFKFFSGAAAKVNAFWVRHYTAKALGKIP